MPGTAFQDHNLWLEYSSADLSSDVVSIAVGYVVVIHTFIELSRECLKC